MLDGGELVVGERYGGVGGVGTLWRQHCRVEEDVPDARDILNHVAQAKLLNHVDNGGEVGVVGESEEVGLVAAWVGHEPHAQFCDDAVVRLSEEAVVVWAEAVGKQLPGCVSWLFVWGGAWLRRWMGQGAHAGSDEFAGWEDDFHPAMHLYNSRGRGRERELSDFLALEKTGEKKREDQQNERKRDTYHKVIPIRRIPHPPLNTIPKHTAPTQIWSVHPQLILQPSTHQLGIQIRVRHTRLDQAGGSLRVDIQHAIQVATQIKSYAAGDARGGAAVANVTAGGKGPDGDGEVGGEAHEGLDFGDVAGGDDG